MTVHKDGGQPLIACRWQVHGWVCVHAHTCVLAPALAIMSALDNIQGHGERGWLKLMGDQQRKDREMWVMEGRSGRNQVRGGQRSGDPQREGDRHTGRRSQGREASKLGEGERQHQMRTEQEESQGELPNHWLQF